MNDELAIAFRRFYGSDKNRRQFVSFTLQVLQFLWLDKFSFNQ